MTHSLITAYRLIDRFWSSPPEIPQEDSPPPQKDEEPKNMPEDFLYRSFSFFTMDSLVRSSRVCREWHRVVIRYPGFKEMTEICNAIDLNNRPLQQVRTIYRCYVALLKAKFSKASRDLTLFWESPNYYPNNLFNDIVLSSSWIQLIQQKNTHRIKELILFMNNSWRIQTWTEKIAHEYLKQGEMVLAFDLLVTFKSYDPRLLPSQLLPFLSLDQKKFQEWLLAFSPRQIHALFNTIVRQCIPTGLTFGEVRIWKDGFHETVLPFCLSLCEIIDDVSLHGEDPSLSQWLLPIKNSLLILFTNYNFYLGNFDSAFSFLAQVKGTSEDKMLKTVRVISDWIGGAVHIPDNDLDKFINLINDSRKQHLCMSAPPTLQALCKILDHILENGDSALFFHPDFKSMYTTLLQFCPDDKHRWLHQKYFRKISPLLSIHAYLEKAFDLHHAYFSEGATTIDAMIDAIQLIQLAKECCQNEKILLENFHEKFVSCYARYRLAEISEIEEKRLAQIYLDFIV